MPSQKTQVAIVMGLGIFLAVLDWITNDSHRTAVAVAAGAALGAVILFARKLQQGRDRS